MPRGHTFTEEEVKATWDGNLRPQEFKAMSICQSIRNLQKNTRAPLLAEFWSNPFLAWVSASTSWLSRVLLREGGVLRQCSVHQVQHAGLGAGHTLMIRVVTALRGQVFLEVCPLGFGEKCYVLGPRGHQYRL